MNNYLTNKSVAITGGNGFLGSQVVRAFSSAKPKSIKIIDMPEYDLRKREACARAVKGADIVIHLAAKVGGLWLNKDVPGELFYDNALMGMQLIEESRLAKVKKFVLISTICAYPDASPIPFKEEDIWNGYPEEANAFYGLSKRMLMAQLQAYRKQYDLNGISLLPTNMYGTGDNYSQKYAHVMPALIRKIYEAKKYNKTELVVWGTGRATREFLFVEDAAQAILLATQKYNSPEPVNIGSGQETSIKDLVKLICSLMDYRGRVVWDTSKPDGQPRRLYDVSRAKKEFGFSATTALEVGVGRSIAEATQIWDQEK